jgi:probable F420-dependent oxidoreductase
VLDTNRETALATARAGMSVYLRAPNYVTNLKRYGFTDDDLADGPSERLVEAIVAMGDVQAVMDRVDAHFAAGASHVCVQVLEADQRTVPEGAWKELGAAISASSAK